MRQLPYDALAVAYVNATKDEPRLMRSRAPQKKRRSKKIKEKSKKREKSLFDPGRHFPVPYFTPFENFKTGGRRIPGAHRSSGRGDRPSSSLCARQNAAPMMHGAATAADLDQAVGVSHSTCRGRCT